MSDSKLFSKKTEEKLIVYYVSVPCVDLDAISHIVRHNASKMEISRT